MPARLARTSLENAGNLQQIFHGVSGLSAVGNPLLCLFAVNLDDRGLLGGVVVAQLFDKAAIAGITGISDNNAVKGSLFAPIRRSLILTAISICLHKIE